MTHTTNALRVLRIDASSRQQDSTTRQLTHHFISALQKQQPIQLQTRDVSSGLPFIDQQWIGANFTAPEQRNDAQHAALRLSDQLIQELVDADVIVIGSPLYNFSVPATLKAWIDQVARAGVTFRYTANGPEGLLQGKKAYVLMATGGTQVGSTIDFASGYLRHVLGFIGLHDVEIIAAERINQQSATALASAKQLIDQTVANLF